MPDAETERARYATHHNDLADEGYVRFLSRVVTPLKARVKPGAEGLDFGSGPSPVLAELLRREGYAVAAYDPFFAPDEVSLERTYDFVTCTETAEHFHEPAAAFEKLATLLRPGATLAVMTQLVDYAPPLATWHYARDYTHVCLYSKQTMDWIARRFGWSWELVDKDVALFRGAYGQG